MIIPAIPPYITLPPERKSLGGFCLSDIMEIRIPLPEFKSGSFCWLHCKTLVDAVKDTRHDLNGVLIYSAVYPQMKFSAASSLREEKLS